MLPVYYDFNRDSGTFSLINLECRHKKLIRAIVVYNPDGDTFRNAL